LSGLPLPGDPKPETRMRNWTSTILYSHFSS
jgi:hypothetical protein